MRDRDRTRSRRVAEHALSSARDVLFRVWDNLPIKEIAIFNHFAHYLSYTGFTTRIVKERYEEGVLT